jgi:ABC-type polar amino acid transport system ATPase subunit
LLIEARNLVKRFGASTVLDSVSVSVRQGETLAVTGESGAGKSTLLRCLNYLSSFDSGEVVVSGRTLGPGLGAHDPAVRQVRQSLGMVFQEFNLFPHLTVLENVTLGPKLVLGVAPSEAEARAERLLGRVHLSGKLRAKPGELSGGQKQRVAIARALAMEPVALLMDEPTSALDPKLKGEVASVIEELRSDGMTMIVVTHETDLARRVATRVVTMEAGKIVRNGPAAEVLTG